MQDYQQQFIQFALDRHTLRFGEFTLKSGRKSPYFFNAGLFNTGDDLRQLGQFYAAAIENANIDYDVIFGPAYKGIPLVTATSIALSEYHKNVPYAFNRKEAKTYGDGGNIVGADMKGKKVLIIDDVITAGTAIRESVELLAEIGAHFCGVVIALDRQERGLGTTSAIQEIEEQHNVPVINIINFDNLVEFLREHQHNDEIKKMQQYQQHYGVL